jgi:hypothetical protein
MNQCNHTKSEANEILINPIFNALDFKVPLSSWLVSSIGCRKQRLEANEKGLALFTNTSSEITIRHITYLMERFKARPYFNKSLIQSTIQIKHSLETLRRIKALCPSKIIHISISSALITRYFSIVSTPNRRSSFGTSSKLHWHSIFYDCKLWNISDGF